MIIGKDPLIHHRLARVGGICAHRQLEMLTSNEISLFFGRGKSDLELILSALL
jgi:hypothetical protein